MTQAEKSARCAEARRYIDKIRNGPKKTYAVNYWNFLVDFSHEPAETGLSAMGAQAVRLRLQPIWKGELDRK